MVLQLNGANNLAVTSATPNFSFPTAVPSGSVYTVSVSSQPVAQTCGVTNGSGTLGGANVNNVIISCTTNVSSSTYSVSANVTGLAGSGLALRLNGGSAVGIASDGTVTLGTGIGDATAYSIAVSTQPSSPSQTCTVANSSGTVSGANVTVAVTCATNVYTVGGTISGLAGSGLQLQLNGGDNLSVTANGSFTFASAIADGSIYAVTVRTQPTSRSQTCTVTQPSSTVSGANVTSVQVSCTTNSFPVFVSVNGLSGAGLVLQNNGGPGLAVSANGSFAFANSVLSGATYLVTVATQPSSPAQTCTLTNGTGTVGNGSVTNVVVNCATNTYAVGGSVSGLSGSGLVLELNGSTSLSITADRFAFSPIADTSAYAVTIATHPTGQTCAVANGTGTIAGAAVTNVAVSCSVMKWSGIKQFGSAADDVVNAVAVDPDLLNGGVVVVGCYQGAFSGNQKGTCDMPGGNAQAYVRKYGPTGDLKWERSLGNSANTQANGVAIDDGGNIYITGVSQGTLDGQPGHNDDDYFLTKYARDGTKRWTGVYGGASSDRGNALAFDASGDLYLVGTVYNNTNGYDVYVAKFSKTNLDSLTTPPSGPAPTATFASSKVGPEPNDFAFHIAAGGGYVYVSGTTLGSLNPDGVNTNANAGQEDAFVMQLDAATLAHRWTWQIGTSSSDSNGGLAVDGGGNVYVAGFTGLCLTDPSIPTPCSKTPGVNDLFVVKYNASGVKQWTHQVFSPGQDYATDMAISPDGSLYVTGYTKGNFSGNRNADASGNTTDVFLVKYDGSGTMLWSRQIGTTTDDRPYAVAIDTYSDGGDHGAFVAGYTLGALDGNTNVGGADMFIIKYDAAGTRQ